MRPFSTPLARPLDTDGMPWIPTGPGNYVYEPAGIIDRWGAVGDEPCIVHIKVAGIIEYLGADGEVTETVSAATQREVYLAWCREHGVRPDDQILGVTGTGGNP